MNSPLLFLIAVVFSSIFTYTLRPPLWPLGSSPWRSPSSSFALAVEETPLPTLLQFSTRTPRCTEGSCSFFRLLPCGRCCTSETATDIAAAPLCSFKKSRCLLRTAKQSSGHACADRINSTCSSADQTSVRVHSFSSLAVASRSSKNQSSSLRSFNTTQRSFRSAQAV